MQVVKKKSTASYRKSLVDRYVVFLLFRSFERYGRLLFISLCSALYFLDCGGLSFGVSQLFIFNEDGFVPFYV